MKGSGEKNDMNSDFDCARDARAAAGCARPQTEKAAPHEAPSADHAGRSKAIARAAIRVALSASREEEKALVREYGDRGLLCAAADFGGPFANAIPRLIERAVVAARREGVIGSTHPEEGAVAGAAHEAVTQLMNKAMCLNVGGKIGIAREGDSLAVCVFLSIGLLHLDEVAIGFAHRVI